MKKTFELDFRGRKLVVETGELAKQASGSVLVRYGDTVVLSTAVVSPNANILKISDEELHFVTEACGLKELEDIAEIYKNLEFILLTQGENGATVFDCKNKKEYSQKAPKTKVASTVGAGDSFGATFICEYFKTNDIQKSLKKATEISAFVVSKKEAIPEY